LQAAIMRINQLTGDIAPGLDIADGNGLLLL
jgi:hypothetical protein